MALDWTPTQVKIYNLLTVEGQDYKEIVAAGFDKGLVFKVKKAVGQGEVPSERKTLASSKPKINPSEAGDNIKALMKNYRPIDGNILFIMDRDGNIEDFRLKFPEAVPMYLDCLKDPIGFRGSLDEWLFSMTKAFLRVIGWEYGIVPRSHGLIYNDVERLVEEGLLKVHIDKVTGNPTLEVVNNGNGSREEGSDGGGGEGEGGGGEGEPTGESEASGPGTPGDETHARKPPKGKKQSAKAK